MLSKINVSFIFSIKNATLSNVEDTDHAMYYKCNCGPFFGSDIIIWASSESINFDTAKCRKCYYEKKDKRH